MNATFCACGKPACITYRPSIGHVTTPNPRRPYHEVIEWDRPAGPLELCEPCYVATVKSNAEHHNRTCRPGLGLEIRVPAPYRPEARQRIGGKPWARKLTAEQAAKVSAAHGWDGRPDGVVPDNVVELARASLSIHRAYA